MTNFPYTMTFHPNKQFDLSNFNSISFQPDKPYKNALDFYVQKSSEYRFGNPSSNNVWNKAGGQPTRQTIHKMIERKRRKDMNSLYSELRSLLPEESIRRKRAAKDLVEEAAKYIGCLQQQIKDLSNQRDKKKTRATCSKGLEISNPLDIQGSDDGFRSVKIRSFGSAAFQVYINSFKNQIALSDILVALEECSVEVVSAASSAINEKVFHTIHAKGTGHSITHFDTMYVRLQHLIGDV